jgi:hypothetical protein
MTKKKPNKKLAKAKKLPSVKSMRSMRRIGGTVG